MKPAFMIFPLMMVLSIGCALAEEAPHAGESSIRKTKQVAIRERPKRPDVLDDFYLLFRLQDEAAGGQPDSVMRQKQLIEKVGAELNTFLKSAPPLQLRLIAFDVAAYVLSGGTPEAAEALAKLDILDEHARIVLSASSAFMHGHRDDAKKALKTTDVQHVPIRLKGRIALAQALLSGDDMNAFQAHLAVAIATMPGTLVEESALRRSALGYAETRNETQFWERLARYQRRFPKSLYAPAFWREISRAIIAWSAVEPRFHLERIESEWSGIDSSHRRALFLGLTRMAAAANEQRTAEFAAGRLLVLSTVGSQEYEAAKLYMAIYKVTSPQGDDALRSLKSVRRDLLNAQDRQILRAALALSEQINRPLPAVSQSARSESDPVQQQGQKALTESDSLLEDLSL